MIILFRLFILYHIFIETDLEVRCRDHIWANIWVYTSYTLQHRTVLFEYLYEYCTDTYRAQIHHTYIHNTHTQAIT